MSRRTLLVTVAGGFMLTLVRMFTSPIFLMNLLIAFTRLDNVGPLAVRRCMLCAKGCGFFKATLAIALNFK
jgi:hypothetical protein